MTTLELLNGKHIRVEEGWKHSPYRTHYCVSPTQAKHHRLCQADIPVCSGIEFFIGPENPGRCPHCCVREGVGEQGYTIIRAD